MILVYGSAEQEVCSFLINLVQGPDPIINFGVELPCFAKLINSQGILNQLASLLWKFLWGGLWAKAVLRFLAYKLALHTGKRKPDAQLRCKAKNILCWIFFQDDPNGITWSRYAHVPDDVLDSWHPWEKVCSLRCPFWVFVDGLAVSACRWQNWSRM